MGVLHQDCETIVLMQVGSKALPRETGLICLVNSVNLAIQRKRFQKEPGINCLDYAHWRADMLWQETAGQYSTAETLTK